MQFAYQFPERAERLVLVSSGGLGPEVSPAIRAITTPGFHQAMSVLAAPGLRHVDHGGDAAAGRHRREPAARPRRGRRHLRLVQGPAQARRDRPRRPRGGRLEGPDRHHGRPGLPHRGDADVRGVGRRRHGHPGRARQQRERPRADGADRDPAQRRTLPAQGPPRAVHQDRARLHPLERAEPLRPGAVARPARRRRRRSHRSRRRRGSPRSRRCTPYDARRALPSPSWPRRSGRTGARPGR